MGQSGQGLLHFFCWTGEEVVPSDGAGAYDAAGDIQGYFNEAGGEFPYPVETVVRGVAEIPLPCGVLAFTQAVYPGCFGLSVAAGDAAVAVGDAALEVVEEILCGHSSQCASQVL